MKDYIKDRLGSDYEVSDYQRVILKRSLKRGSISSKDYETAWSDYKQCVLDKGYREVKLIKLNDGIYIEANGEGGTDSQINQFSADEDQCNQQYLSHIDWIYKMQVGNPNLIENQEESTVDCLRRKKVVKQSYSAQDFRNERKKGKYSYDVEKDPDANACLVANGYGYLPAGSPVEHPFG